MKTITLVFGAFIIFSLSACGQGYKKLPESEVATTKVKIAQTFANNYLTTLRNDSFYQFKDEAVDILKNQLTEERQKAGYKQLKDNFGDYKSLDYAETWIQKENSAFKILRFKGDFDKSIHKLEIRVILNDSDKINGFWIKPWSDMLQ